MGGETMRNSISMVAFACLFALVGCGTKVGTNAIKDVPGVPATLTAQQAGEQHYRYAFSGQILSALTGTAIKNFTVQPASNVAGVNTVVNALGDANGLFH